MHDPPLSSFTRPSLLNPCYGSFFRSSSLPPYLLCIFFHRNQKGWGDGINRRGLSARELFEERFYVGKTCRKGRFSGLLLRDPFSLA